MVVESPFDNLHYYILQSAKWISTFLAGSKVRRRTGFTMATATLDIKGLNCPIPIMKAKKRIKDLQAGDTLEVLSTDPGSVRDFESFCRVTGNPLLESGEEAGVFRFVIEKS